MAQTQLSKEAIWLGEILDKLREIFPRLPDGPVIIFTDNQGAIYFSKDPKFHSRTKHLDIL